MLTLINSLAKRFKLPDYAMTNAAEIRTLRLNLALQSPAFMGVGLTTGRMKVGESINPVMSPLQTLHLFQVMVDQKILNPEYQDPLVPPSLGSKRYRKELEAHKGEPAFLSIRPANPKRAEMLAHIASAADSLTFTEGIDLLNQMLYTSQ